MEYTQHSEASARKLHILLKNCEAAPCSGPFSHLATFYNHKGSKDVIFNRKSIQFLFSSALAVTAFSASTAQAEVYACEFSDPGRNNTIPKIVVVDVKSASEALVSDPILAYMQQAPKKASFVKNTSDLLRVRWTVDDMKFSGGGQRDMKFSLVHRKAKGKAHLNLLIVGADNTDRGTGRCKLQP